VFYIFLQAKNHNQGNGVILAILLHNTRPPQVVADVFLLDHMRSKTRKAAVAMQSANRGRNGRVGTVM